MLTNEKLLFASICNSKFITKYIELNINQAEKRKWFRSAWFRQVCLFTQHSINGANYWQREILVVWKSSHNSASLGMKYGRWSTNRLGILPVMENNDVHGARKFGRAACENVAPKQSRKIFSVHNLGRHSQSAGLRQRGARARCTQQGNDKSPNCLM